MVTQLKSYLLQSTELHSMLEPQHQYTQDKLGKSASFSADALCASVIRSSIYYLHSLPECTDQMISITCARFLTEVLKEMCIILAG